MPAGDQMATQLWSKLLADGAAAALVINGASVPYEVTVAFAELNVSGTAAAVKDVWTGTALAVSADGFTTTVPPMDSAFVVVTPQGRATA